MNTTDWSNLTFEGLAALDDDNNNIDRDALCNAVNDAFVGIIGKYEWKLIIVIALVLYGKTRVTNEGEIGSKWKLGNSVRIDTAMFGSSGTNTGNQSVKAINDVISNTQIDEKTPIGQYISNKFNNGYYPLNPNIELTQNSRAQLNALKTIFGSNSHTQNSNNGAQAESELETEIKDLINEGNIRQIIFTGAPGTGKTFIAKRIADDLGTVLNNNKKYEFVQFHPSYDYTDFVEGLRPVDNNGSMIFVKMDGVFKKFCRSVVEANNNPNNNGNNPEEKDGKKENSLPLYFFLIDEINRADLSKVFGELMYCLEKDKRGDKNKVNTQYQNLQTKDEKGTPIKPDCFAAGFYIPKNVVIIGTMNDIDRSVESMDFALRRRFEWKEFKVKDIIEEAIVGTLFGNNPTTNEEKEIAKEISDSIKAINKIIEGDGRKFGLNRQYDISQGQFANIPDKSSVKDIKERVKDIKDYVWKYRIESLLREYLRGEDEAQVLDFIKKCLDNFMNPNNIQNSGTVEAGNDEESDIDEQNKVTGA